MRSTTSLKRGAALLPVAAVLAFPLTAGASTTISLGHAFGGFTSQGNPISFGNDLMTTKIPWMVVALDLKCGSGGGFTTSVGYKGLKVSKSRTFHGTTGQQTQHFPDGTSAVGQGTIRGTLNRSRLKASGTSEMKVTFMDANGATTDTCDSGVVHWRAIQ